MSNSFLNYEITALRVDEMGYYRDQNNYLVHRTMAFRLVYLPNRQKYEIPFKFYQVHHIDKNKKNNLPHNLLILTKSEHNFLHWVCGNCKRWNQCMNVYDHKYVCPDGKDPQYWQYYKDVGQFVRK